MVLTNEQIQALSCEIVGFFYYKTMRLSREYKALFFSCVCSNEGQKIVPCSCTTTTPTTTTGSSSGMDPTKCNCPCMDNPICNNCSSWHQQHPGAVHA